VGLARIALRVIGCASARDDTSLQIRTCLRSPFGQTLRLGVGIIISAIMSGSRCEAEPLNKVTYGAFIDGYIAHDFNHLPGRYRAYTTQPYYSDEAAVNLGLAEAAWDSTDYQGRVALQYGSSVIANYAQEPHLWWRYVQEAYAGLKISSDLSLDAGVFFSHLGGESWISRDNLTLTRSMIAENSPYYESGVRARYSFSEVSHGELYIVRGWQNISDVQDPAIGTRFTRRFNDGVSLSHSSFVGNKNGLRVFNASSISYSWSERMKIAGEYHVGVQERRADTTAWWQGWAVTMGFAQNSKLSWAIRAEHYSDPHQVLVTTLSGDDFRQFGVSLNLDWTIAPGLVWRNEYRSFMSSADVFPRRNQFSSYDQFVVSSLQYSISVN